MRNVARILAGVIALLYLVFGIRFMFLTDGAMASAGLEAVNILGMATARAFIGGGFLAFGILLVMHTVLNQENWCIAVCYPPSDINARRSDCQSNC